MIGNKKRNSWCMVAFASIAMVALCIYSCSAEEYEDANEQDAAKSEVLQSRAHTLEMRYSGNELIDSVAASDEFWEFIMSSRLLAQKFDAYASTLSNEEYDGLMENLNDDEYTEEFIAKAKLEKELQQVDIASENLLKKTGFTRLSDDERELLFTLFAESSEQTLLKTRTEGGSTSECEKIKQAAYAQADVDYKNAITKCLSASSTYTCRIQATAERSKNKDIADINYNECLQKK